MKVLETFTGAEGYEFKVVEYDSTLKADLEEFCDKCGDAGILNNASLKALKFGKWGSQENWWFVYNEDKIVSMAGAHYLPHVHYTCYMINYRLATLPEWRNMADDRQNTRRMYHEFGFARLVPFMVDWAHEQGATDCVVTTASQDHSEDRSGTMHKIWRFAYVAWPHEDKLTLLHKDFPLYGIKQDVWKFNWRNFRTGERIEKHD